MDMHLVTDPYACIVYVVSPLAGDGGIVWRPHYRRHNLFVSAAAVAVVVAAAVVCLFVYCVWQFKELDKTLQI